MEQYALLKRLDAIEAAVGGLIQQQRALVALPELVGDQIKLIDLRWNFMIATARGDADAGERGLQLDKHSRLVEEKYGGNGHG